MLDLRKSYFVVWDEFFQTPEQNQLKSLPSRPHYEELKKTFFSPAKISAQKILSPQEDANINDTLQAYTDLISVRQPNLLILNLGPDGNIGWITQSTSNSSVHLVNLASQSADFTQGRNLMSQKVFLFIW